MFSASSIPGSAKRRQILQGFALSRPDPPEKLNSMVLGRWGRYKRQPSPLVCPLRHREDFSKLVKDGGEVGCDTRCGGLAGSAPYSGLSPLFARGPSPRLVKYNLGPVALTPRCRMPDSAPQPSADRNLLLGILALQMDFVGRDALIAAMHAWVLDKAKPLGQILQEQRALPPEERALLETLVDRHLQR